MAPATGECMDLHIGGVGARDHGELRFAGGHVPDGDLHDEHLGPQPRVGGVEFRHPEPRRAREDHVPHPAEPALGDADGKPFEHWPTHLPEWKG